MVFKDRFQIILKTKCGLSRSHLYYCHLKRKNIYKVEICKAFLVNKNVQSFDAKENVKGLRLTN